MAVGAATYELRRADYRCLLQGKSEPNEERGPQPQIQGHGGTPPGARPHEHRLRRRRTLLLEARMAHWRAELDSSIWTGWSRAICCRILEPGMESRHWQVFRRLDGSGFRRRGA